jgi:NADPH2:quinone reductase
VVDSSLGVEAVVEKVKEITGGHGVDVIFDGIGKATFDGDLEMVARKGTVAVFGNAVSLLALLVGVCWWLIAFTVRPCWSG